MNGVVGQVRRTITSIRERIIRDLIRRQKPELDQKIDEMLKPPKVNRIMIRFLGVGGSVGRKLGGYVGRGLSLLRKLL
jgi:hypothetical protein